jgi:Uroporphyrinogen decarboxylase (URO-D)
MPSWRRLVIRDGAQDCDTQAGCLATGTPKAAQAALPNSFQPNVTAMLTSRERLITTLEHRQPDRVCVDVGGSGTSGIHASTLSRLRRELLGDQEFRIRVAHPMMLTGEIDDDLRQALPVDVVGVAGSMNMLGFRNDGWKPWELSDGTPVLVPGDFQVTAGANGDLFLYPGGDTSVAPSGLMPEGGFYFDPIVRQEPLDETLLDPADNCEEFRRLSDEDVTDFARRAERLAMATDYGVFAMLPGVWGYGDIMFVPGPGLKHPRGIRDPEEWYISLLTRPAYIHAVFERQTEIALDNIRRLAAAVGDHAQVARICGTDFGGQNAPLISRRTYRDLFSPYYRQINAAIHTLTKWKTFKHCDGSIRELIPDFIEDGFDILNPIQSSADNMNPRTLKREFGDQLVFWGGGVETQTTLPFGTPDDVYREVRERIDIFNDGGGYVFAAIHNVQAKVPVANLRAMFRAIRDSWGDHID